MGIIRHVGSVRCTLTVISILTSLALSGHHAFAYDRSKVVNYAETYWQNYNPYFFTVPDDCTNFVSQAEWAGGLPMTGYPDQHDAWTWWENGYGYAPPYGSASTSDTWVLTNKFYMYLDAYASNPLVYDYGRYAYSQYNNQMYTWANDGLSLGDMVFYDWTSDGTWDHAAVQVYYGTDTWDSFYYGSLVDAHTSNRHEVIWTLREFNNDNYATTTIGLMHVNA